MHSIQLSVQNKRPSTIIREVTKHFSLKQILLTVQCTLNHITTTSNDFKIAFNFNIGKCLIVLVQFE